MKWSWTKFLTYLGVMAVLSFAGTYVASFFVDDGRLKISESQETQLAMFLGALGGSLVLVIVGAFRAWRLSHLLAAIAIVGGLFGGNVSAAIIILILASVVFLAANKGFQILRYYLPTPDDPDEVESEPDNANLKG